MWLETESKGTVKLKYKSQITEEYEVLEFSEKGTVQVAEDVGEEVIERFGTVSEFERNENGYINEDE